MESKGECGRNSTYKERQYVIAGSVQAWGRITDGKEIYTSSKQVAGSSIQIIEVVNSIFASSETVSMYGAVTSSWRCAWKSL